MFKKEDVCESAKKAVAHQRLVCKIEEIPQQVMTKFHLPSAKSVCTTAQLSGFYQA